MIYLMGRDQRVMDNWAMFHAWLRAREMGSPLGIVLCLDPELLSAGPRQYQFMLEGLQDVTSDAKSVGVPFFLLHGDPATAIPRFVEEWNVSMIVTDFDPLHIKGRRMEAVKERTECGLEEVDAHNVVPCWTSSPKQEYSAATFRPKLLAHLNDYIDHLPPLPTRGLSWPGDMPEGEIDKALVRSNAHQGLWRAGWKGANETLFKFLRAGLEGYDRSRNDPVRDAQSKLSPYLHFGTLSAQAVAISVRGSSAPQADKEAFLDELLVRRELSDNYCHYNLSYDRVQGFPAWSRATLAQHTDDRRDHLYTEEELEGSRTHDPLWNAAQRQMVLQGKMHGWLRMYWAKKVLEWTDTPDEALRIVISLNDRYEMDGRDPNGYVGAAWSIGGVHDRAWTERPIFGKVRYMNLNGARRKFDVDGFIEMVNNCPDRSSGL